MNGSIGQQQENLVSCGLGWNLLCVCQELLKKWGEQSWTSQPDASQSLLICCHNILNSNDLWVSWISIDWETMRNLSNLYWDSSETKHWERSISIVWFDDLTDRSQGSDVFVLWVHGMKGTWLTLISIWCSVVNGGDHGDCPSRSQVFNEWWFGKKSAVVESDLRLSVSKSLSLTSPKKSNIGLHSVKCIASLWVEDDEANIKVEVSIADSRYHMDFFVDGESVVIVSRISLYGNPSVLVWNLTL